MRQRKKEKRNKIAKKVKDKEREIISQKKNNKESEKE